MFKQFLYKIYNIIKLIYCYFYNNLFNCNFLNLGGGPNFVCKKFVNLDSAKGLFNKKIIFNDDFKINYPNSSFNLVYTSHCFEHLNYKTVENLISQSSRVLIKGKKLIIKIPNYDEILMNFRKKNLNYFYIDIEKKIYHDDWGVKEIISSWKNHGIKNNLENFVSFLFVSFFDKKLSSYFEEINKKSLNPFYFKKVFYDQNNFFGPALINKDKLINILNNLEPKQIVEILKKKNTKKNLDNRIFCHQSAWSKQDLLSLLKKNDFKFISDDKKKVIKKYNFINDIHLMQRWSIYIEASKL